MLRMRKKQIRKFLSNSLFIHILVFLGLFALLGNIINGNKYLIFFSVLSFSGAVCGSFIKLIDKG
jgi:hypothetical protein